MTVTSDKYSEGEFKRVTGGKAYFAMVGIHVIPDNKLTFEILLPEEEKEVIIREEWFESICMGVLDVMLKRLEWLSVWLQEKLLIINCQLFSYPLV